MLTVRALLERDPDREIVGVVKIDDHDPARVWVEMDEYVATDEVGGYLRDFVERFLESRRLPGEEVCIWVSGFFGSGKSHFLKVLGYLVENRRLAGPAQTALSSTEFLCAKLGLSSFAPLLTREFKNRVLYINLLNHDPQAPTRPTISRLVYRTLLEEKGLAKDFWVASWEEEIQSLGKWTEFNAWVKTHYGRSWEQERRLNADPVLSRVLPELFPERFHDEAAARRALDDSKQRAEEVRPGDVARHLRREAESLDPVKGRLIVLLDEIGLYIGDSIERLTDLNSLAEQVVMESRGKVWLVASAQEALAELVPRLTTDRQILGWLQDRFRMRIQLTPGNIERVVSERLLKKRPEAVIKLGELYDRAAGTLAAGASLKGVRSGRLEATIIKERFIGFYPLLPHYILLLQEIFSALRQRGTGSEESRRRLGGRERSMLQTLHAVLRGEGSRRPFTDQPVGCLVTFDLLFDAIGTELSIIQSDHYDAIVNRVAAGGVSAPCVAKALFLLQQVGEWLPCSLENVAAVIHPDLGTDVNTHREAVKKSLEALIEASWVIEEQGTYRFLSPAEHDFEREVRGSQPTPAEKKQAVFELMRGLLQRVRYEHGARAKVPLDVALKVDGQELRGAGDLKVRLYTPFAQKEKDEVLAESLAESDAVFWLAAGSPELEHVLVRTLAIEKAHARWQGRPLTREQDAYVSRLRREALDNRQVRLPGLLERAFGAGTIFIAGTESRPEGSQLAAGISSALRQVAQNLFTEFLDVPIERDEDCSKVLGWRPGVPLPPVYSELGLVGGGGVNPGCQVASRVFGELARRQQQGLECTGGALAEYFKKQPYGWDPRLVRLTLAALLKNGNICVLIGNRELTNPLDNQVKDAFGNSRQFRATTFKILPPVDWRAARELFVELTGEGAGDTFEEVSEKVKQLAGEWNARARQLADRIRDLGLPAGYAQVCLAVERALQAVVRCADPNARLRAFLDEETALRQNVPLFRRLADFEEEFGRYRQLDLFARAAAGWAREDLSTELKSRWQAFSDGLVASDLLDRWNEIWAAYGVLKAAFQGDYHRRHENFRFAAQRAVAVLREHPAFPDEEGEAEELLRPVQGLICEGRAEGEDLLCPLCRRGYAELAPALVEEICRRLTAELDERLVFVGPGPGDEFVPLDRREIIAGPTEADALLKSLQAHLRLGIAGGRKVVVEVRIRREEDP